MKKIILKSTGFLSLCLLLMTCCFLLLPYVSDSYIIPHLLKSIPQDDKNISISRVSPFHFRANVELKNNGEPVISAPRVELFYSPTSLIKGKINKLLLDHAIVHLTTEGDKPAINLPPLSETKGKAEKRRTKINSPGQILSSLPATIDTIQLNQCQFVLHGKNGKTNTVTIDGHVAITYDLTPEKTVSLTGVDIQFITHGTVSVGGKLIFANEGDVYSVTSRDIRISRLGDLTEIIPQLSAYKIAGELEANLSVSLDKETLSPKMINIHAELPGFSMYNSSFRVQSNNHISPVFSVQGTPDHLTYSINKVNIVTPIKSDVALEGTITTKPSPSTQGNFVISASPPLPENHTSIKLDGKYSFTSKDDSSWLAELTIENDSKIKLAPQDNSSLDCSTASFSLSAAGINNQIEATLKLAVANTNIIQQNSTIAIPEINTASDISIQNGDIVGNIHTVIPHVFIEKQNLIIENTTLKTPFSLTTTSEKPAVSGKGSVEVKKLLWDNQHLASLTGSLTFNNDKLDFSSTLSTPMQADLSAKIDVSSNYSTAHTAKIEIPATTINSNSFAPFLPIPDNINFEGKVQLVGNYVVENSKSIGFANFKTIDLNFSMPESEVYLNNISMNLDFPNLPIIQSKPSQRLSIEEIELGALVFTDAQVFFRVEDQNNFFIEKSRLRWCGGKVESGSLRLSQGLETVDTTLYCDRLNFASLLTQFGIDDTEGAGSLNGKLPIHFSKKGIFFDDGFLYSTPGEKGIMHFNNTNMLSSSMPNLDQTGTLSYSLQALENFAYNWSRLTFSSKEDVLTLSMEIEGKPAVPLPFGYKKGQIVSDPTGPGLQHPVRLDLNFNLPQEDIFRYGKNLQSLKENL